MMRQSYRYSRRRSKDMPQRMTNYIYNRVIDIRVITELKCILEESVCSIIIIMFEAAQDEAQRSK